MRRNPSDCVKTLTRLFKKSTRFLNSKNKYGQSLLEQVMRNASAYGDEVCSIVQKLVSLGARVEETPSLVESRKQSSGINAAILSGQEVRRCKGVLGTDGLELSMLVK